MRDRAPRIGQCPRAARSGTPAAVRSGPRSPPLLHVLGDVTVCSSGRSARSRRGAVALWTAATGLAAATSACPQGPPRRTLERRLRCGDCSFSEIPRAERPVERGWLQSIALRTPRRHVSCAGSQQTSINDIASTLRALPSIRARASVPRSGVRWRFALRGRHESACRGRSAGPVSIDDRGRCRCSRLARAASGPIAHRGRVDACPERPFGGKLAASPPMFRLALGTIGPRLSS